MKRYFIFLCILLTSCQNKEEQAFEAFEAEDYQQALQLFSEVSAMDPNNWYHLFNVARCLEELKRYDEAVSWYSKSLKYKPESDEILIARGRALLQTGYIEGAYTDISRVLIKNDKNFEANYLMGRIAMADNDPWQALTYLNNAISIDDSEVNLYYHRAIAMGSVGNTFGAIRDLNYVLSQKQDFNQAYYNRGILLMRNLSFREAIEDFDAAEALEYSPVELYVRRGDCKTMLRQTGACKDYEMAAEMDKRYQKLVKEQCGVASVPGK